MGESRATREESNAVRKKKENTERQAHTLPIPSTWACGLWGPKKETEDEPVCLDAYLVLSLNDMRIRTPNKERGDG
ncbi:hypothetical protein L249_2474 [Ophiocordyceps polyrhachis-furcata BCC 54312]|uniref:Uncharacterized protein n=1 Tax=Ophiocordyceps polyrhachis-furcata BCC 54312 TaxID=1330021 RepID=A0A367LPY6_9HYPO|nr:hypothetical protein L249_2474 [Ophiocordyceps polyrhachis-furcata BCC 54312]